MTMKLSRSHLQVGWITLSVTLGLCPLAQAGRVEVVLVPRPGITAPAEVVLVLSRDQGELLPTRRQVSLDSPRQAFEVGEGVWTIEATGDGVWAPARKVTVRKDSERRIEVEVYEATAVRGRVEVEQGEALPTEIGIELYPPIEKLGPGKTRPPHVPSEALAFRCPAVKGEFQCPAPIGKWDVRVRAADHISHYLWNVAFPKKAAAELGRFVLRRGASIVGWVMAAGPVKPGAEWHLELAPMQAAATPSAAETARVFSAEAQADERGFFHFTGISPGTYVLTASLEGFAPAKFFPLRVLENRESQLQDILVLHPPMTVEVRVVPETDLQQRPWNVKVFDLGETPGAMELVTMGTAGEGGNWRATELSAGRFLFQLEDSAGVPWAFQEVELATGSAEVAFDLDLVEVEGTLRLGGEPLVAELYFGGKRGVPRFRFETDDAGRFHGHVTREGEWRVDVESTASSVHRSLPRVEVRRGGQQVARVAIDLPDGALRGQVVNEKDQPVPDANIFLSVAGDSPVFARSDAEGEFELRGLGRGHAVVQARVPGEESDAVWLQLQEENQPVRLILKRKREVAGVVLGTYGGVPGAQVLAMAPGEIRAQGATDAAGKFTLQVPVSARYLDLVVLPPGHTLLARRVSLQEEGPLQLFVEPEGGTLVLEEATLIPGQSQSTIVLTQNGTLLSSVNLRHWAEVNGQKWKLGGPEVVPQMAAGQYEVCRVPHSQVQARVQGSSVGNCVRGTLAPGGELTLRVPKEAGAK